MGTRMTSSRAYLALMKETAESEKMRARIAELEAQAKTVEAGYDAARLEIASLQAQLEAVGAGGVSALMGVSQAQPVGAAPVAELVTTAHGFETTLSLLPGHFDLPYGTHLLYAAPQPAAQALDADHWYLQDTRSYVGNDVMWWAKDGKGYTTDVSKAHVYGREEAFRQAAMRGTDRAWPKSYIDGKTRPAVDMQYIDHAAAIAAKQGGANG